MENMKEKLAEKLEEELGLEVALTDIEVPEPEHGDFAYPVMKAASEMGENPRELAEELKQEVEIEGVEKIEVAGPGYLNFFLDREEYAGDMVGKLESENMGVEQKSGSVLVEFSQPNIAKPMHVGHMRNNCLGDSLQRIMRFVGYDVTSENYIGDMGTQFGKVIYGHLNLEVESDFEEEPMEYMLDIYVKFHEKAEENPEIEEKAAEWARKIEEGDEEAVELWKKFREASLDYQKMEYERLGIKFDRITGESKVTEESRELIQKWVEEGKLEPDEDGSVFYEFEGEELPGTVLLKENGSTLYLTRDIYNLKKRKEEGFDYNLYVVASEQELHFKQLFQIAEDFDLTAEDFESEHVSHGMLRLPEGSMSTREGRIVRQLDIIEEARDRARERAEEKIDRKIENAEVIGLAAVKYANISVSRNKDIEFKWDNALSFEGDSGPYIQYSNVRAKSIKEKAEESGEILGEFQKEEYRLLKKLDKFPEKIQKAAESRDPVKVAKYLSAVSEEFNNFYHSCPVLDSDEETMKRRLKLVELFVEVTDQGLELLGIEPLQEM